MIATTRGLVVLAALAVALLVLVVLVGSREHATVDRALLPGFDPGAVSRIELRRGAEAIRLVRAGEAWRFEESNAPVDGASLDAMFTALRAGRWHRRARASAAGVVADPNAAVAVTIGDASFVIGNPIAGSEQTWIVRRTAHEEVALLVDDWIVRALTPDRLALRVRHPVDCSSATSIRATAGEGSVLRVEGRSLAEPQPLWLDDGALGALAAACASLEIIALPTSTATREAPGLRITADGAHVTQIGACDGGRVLVESSAGEGCIEAAAMRALEDAVAAIRDAPARAIDLRPLPIEPVTLKLADGAVLDVAKLRIGDADADRDAVRELVRALTTRGESAIPRPPGRKPRATLRATDRAGTEVVLEIIDNAIGRAGEPSLIRIDPGDLAIITRPSAALRDATRWREDATTISSITLDGITYRRGAVLGEWTRAPAGTVDTSLVDALAESLATVRAPAAAAPRAIRHRLSLTFTPPAGTPITHAIELAPPTGAGCAGRVDGTAVWLPLPLCTAVVAVAASR